jgi:hypothetical protein
MSMAVMIGPSLTLVFCGRLLLLGLNDFFNLVDGCFSCDSIILMPCGWLPWLSQYDSSSLWMITMICACMVLIMSCGWLPQLYLAKLFAEG